MDTTFVVGLLNLGLLQWPAKSLEDWWHGMTGSASLNHKVITSITLLTSKEI
jgi:hypothetical protein